MLCKIPEHTGKSDFCYFYSYSYTVEENDISLLHCSSVIRSTTYSVVLEAGRGSVLNWETILINAMFWLIAQ